jgi:cytochrome c oxidase assembly protein subunit 15
MNGTKIDRWLHRYATFVALATFLLIIAGALVTSNDAGLSVPDWPTSFGSFRMPRMVGGVKFEHGHRMIAGTVVILTVILAVWLWKREERRWVQRLGGIAVLTILAQALLGGITVLYYLPVDISVAHACLAQLFFCIMVSIALFTKSDWHSDRPKLEDASTPSLRHLSIATTISVFVQLMLGAAFRHHGFRIMAHVLVAAVVTIMVFWLLVRVLSGFHNEPRLQRPALFVAGLLVIQIGLGIGSYFAVIRSQNAPQPLPAVVAVTTTHLAVGALLLASCLVLTLAVHRLVREPGRPAAQVISNAIGVGK